jgi:tetratricopeptide (TPR) repeat protein
MALVGASGTGKSTLARMIARQWIDEHPGCRVVALDLRDPTWRFHDVVRELLLGFGVAFDAMPAQFDQQRKLLETMSVGDDIVVFDNVADAEIAEQVAGHLSGSRYIFTGARLSARIRVPTAQISALDRTESRELFSFHGVGRPSARFVDACAGNALAIELAAKALRRNRARNDLSPGSADSASPIEFGLALALSRVGDVTSRSVEDLRGMLGVLVDAGGSAEPDIAGALWVIDDESARSYVTAWADAGVLDLGPAGSLMLRRGIARVVQRGAPKDRADRRLASLVRLTARRARDGGPLAPEILLWLDRNWAPLREAVRRVADGPALHESGPDLPDTIAALRRGAEILNRHYDLIPLDELARAVAQRRADGPAQARALSLLALDYYRMGSVDEAETMSFEAVRQARAVGDPILLATQLIRNGKLALARRHFDEAISSLEDAVRLARERGDETLEIDALLTVAEVYRHVSNTEDAAGALSRVDHLLEGRTRTADDGTLWTRLASAYLDFDRLEDAVAALMSLIEDDGEPDVNTAVALELLGETLERSGEMEYAATALNQAIEWYHENGDLAGEARALTRLARLLLDDQPEAAVLHLQEASRLAEESADLPHLARIQRELGIAYAATGDLNSAQAALMESVRSAGELGDLRAAAVARASLGRLYARVGDLGSARALLEESLRMLTTLGAASDIPAVSRDLADLLIAAGRPEAAVGVLERVAASARDAGDPANELLNLGLLAKAYTEAGQVEDADHARSRARRLAGTLGHRAETTQAVLDLVPRALRRDTESDAVERDLLTLVEQISGPEHPSVSAVSLLGLHWRAAGAAFRAGDTQQAKRHLDAAIDLADRAEVEHRGNRDLEQLTLAARRARASMLRDAGDRSAALRDLEVSLSLARRTAERDPGDAESAALVASVYRQLGDLTVGLGDLRAAENYYRSSLAIVDRLARTDAGTAIEHELEATHRSLGEIARASGDLAVAALEYRQAVDLARRHASTDPEALGSLGGLLLGAGDVARLAGDAVDASAAYSEALAIFRLISNKDPSDVFALRNVSIALNRLGVLSLLTGDPTAGIEQIRDGLAVVERLVEALPGEPLFQRDLAASHRGLGQAYLDTGDVASAMRHFMEALRTTERLASVDSADVLVVRELSQNHASVGELTLQSGDLALARRHFDMSLVITRQLAEAEPDNLALQRDLAMSYVNMIRLLSMVGDNAAADRHRREAMGIARRLVDRDPASADYRDLLSALEQARGGGASTAR